MSLIILSYLAGVLTLLSPCILPVLPFVFARCDKSFMKGGFPILCGMALTFTVFSTLAVTAGTWIAAVNNAGRILSMIFLSIVGLLFIFPALTEKLMSPLSRLGLLINKHVTTANTHPNTNTTINSDSNINININKSANRRSFIGSCLIGVSTGLLWAPCAGPILVLILTGAAVQNDTTKSIILLLAYSTGAVTSLAIFIVIGGRLLAFVKKYWGFENIIKKFFGVIILLGVAAVAFNLDRTILTQISKISTENFEQKLLSLAEKKHENDQIMLNETSPQNSSLSGTEKTSLPVDMPEFKNVTAWMNTKPLSKSDLLGKVVLIDFWTYSCINCLRTLPYLKAWHEKYKDQGLVIIGVHTPEFAFEKILRNVKKAVDDLDIKYPIAVDNQYDVWRAYENSYWPAHYFINKAGKIIYSHFGEGEYEKSEKIIKQLLAENKLGKNKKNKIQSDKNFVKTKGSGVQAPAEMGNLHSPETYIGYKRAENLVVVPELIRDKMQMYSIVKKLGLNDWSLAGVWKVGSESAISIKKHAQIRYKFRARDLHLVLGSSNKKEIHFRVLLDGKPPGENHGEDIDEDGYGVVKDHKLYQLIRQTGENSRRDHLFSIEFLDSKAEAFAFTFG